MLMVPRMFGDVFDDWFDGFDRDMNRIMSRSTPSTARTPQKL